MLIYLKIPCNHFTISSVVLSYDNTNWLQSISSSNITSFSRSKKVINHRIKIVTDIFSSSSHFSERFVKYIYSSCNQFSFHYIFDTIVLFLRCFFLLSAFHLSLKNDKGKWYNRIWKVRIQLWDVLMYVNQHPRRKRRGCCSHKVVAVGFNTLRYDASVGVLNPPHE